MTMACDTPLRMYKKGERMGKTSKIATEDILVPCGKCPPCKYRRVNEWVFRLQEEDKISSSSYFVTLTYNTENVPISNNGFMTLDKTDVQKFFKRLRKNTKQHEKIRYYLAGEYGSKTLRPHYHFICFNLQEKEEILSAWTDKAQKPLGEVHIGQVSGASIAYTAKYIDKAKRIPLHKNDDRQPEFSLMSRRIGESYLTPSRIRYHKEDPTRIYVTKRDGNKIPLPRFYRNEIYNEEERIWQNNYIRQQLEKEENESRDLHERKKSPISYELKKDLEKQGRYNKFYKSKRSKK